MNTISKCESLRSRELAFLRQISARRRRPSESRAKWLRDTEARLAGEAAAMWTPAFTHRSKNFDQKYFDDSNGYQETDL